MTARKYLFGDGDRRHTARSEAADLFLTARLNYDDTPTDRTRAYGILSDAMGTAAWNTVWYLNHGDVDQAKVFAAAHDLLKARQRKLLNPRELAARRGDDGVTLS